jgi:hypothetical protein
MDLEYLKLMNRNEWPMTALPAREELEIGVMVASSDPIVDYLHDGHLAPSDVREALRDVVREIGIGHTDEHLAEMTIFRLRNDLAGRI